MTMQRTFDHYNAGKFDGRGEDHIMFRFYRADGAFGSCELVPASGAAANREALLRMGWTYRHPATAQ
jgi:hypothetical protein